LCSIGGGRIKDEEIAVLAAQFLVERRGEERCPVAWDTEILLTDTRAILRGRIVNITLSGCYVQTAARPLPDSTTEVMLEFVLGTYKVRVYSEVRFTQSPTGFGLRFLRMEETVQSRLNSEILNLRKDATAATVVGKAEPDAETAATGDVGVAEEIAGQLSG
jgi:hypothetical protein